MREAGQQRTCQRAKLPLQDLQYFSSEYLHLSVGHASAHALKLLPQHLLALLRGEAVCDVTVVTMAAAEMKRNLIEGNLEEFSLS